MTTTWASGRSHSEPERRGCKGRGSAADGKNERNDKTEMNKWRLRTEKKGGEINGGDE